MLNSYTFTPCILVLTHQQQTAFENILGKEEIACNERFRLFPLCFLFKEIIVSPFVHIFAIISLFAVKLEKPKIGISGEGLNNSISDSSDLRYFNPLCHTIQTFNSSGKDNFIKHCGKRRKCW